MSKVLNKIRALPYIMGVDDERDSGNCIIITLHEPYCFVDDPHCGTKGCDTIAEVVMYTNKKNIYTEKA